MIKIINLIFSSITILTSVSFAQIRYIEGEIKDTRNSKPVSDVHIFDESGRLRAVTDQDGDFYLSPNSQGKFTATCIGYKTLSFHLSKLVEDTVIFLSEDTLRLNEIVISPLSAQEIIKKSIELIDVNYLYHDIKETGAFNLIIKKDDSVVASLSDPELDILMKGPDYVPQIKESDSVRLAINFDNITSKIFVDLNSQIKNIVDFDHIIHKRGFLNVENLDMWQFEISGYTEFNKINLVIIEANFIDYTNNLHHFGKIFINEEDYGIIKVDFSYSWTRNNYIKSNVDSLWVTDFKWTGRSNYLKAKGKYVLSNLEYMNKKRVSSKDKRNKYIPYCDYEINCNFTSINLESSFR